MERYERLAAQGVDARRRYLNVHSSSAEATRLSPLGLRSRLASMSLAQAATVSTFALVAMLAMRPTSDPDKFWHLATGRWIWENRRIPKADPFSWTKPGQTWVAHEWLTEIIWFRIHQLGGWTGLAILTAAIIVSALLLTHRNVRTVGGSSLVANVLTLTAAVASLTTWGVRPQMLSFLLVALVGRLTLEAWHASQEGSSDSSQKRRRLWLLVPVMLIWANAHGAYIFGIALSGAFAVGLYVDQLLGRIEPFRTIRNDAVSHVDIQLLKTAWAVTASCIVITLANPHGFGGLLYPFTYLGDNASTRYVSEWFAPTFSDPQYWPFGLLLALAAFALIRLRRSMPFFAVIQIVALAFLGLQSIRNITPFAVVALPWIGLSLRRRRPRPLTAEPKGAAVVHAGVAAFVLAATGAVGLPSLQSSAIEAHDAEAFPRVALAWIDANPRQRLLNQYDWGGYLIWNLPTTPVAVDGRPDMYGDTFMDRHISIWQIHKGWQRRLEEDGYERVMGAPTAPVVSRLRLRPGWRVSYEDSQAVVLDRL